VRPGGVAPVRILVLEREEREDDGAGGAGDGDYGAVDDADD
jgi:hypothetical protein